MSSHAQASHRSVSGSGHGTSMSSHAQASHRSVSGSGQGVSISLSQISSDQVGARSRARHEIGTALRMPNPFALA